MTQTATPTLTVVTRKEGAARLRTMIAFLKKLPPDQVDMGSWGREGSCGTAACVAGWTPECFRGDPTLRMVETKATTGARWGMPQWFNGIMWISGVGALGYYSMTDPERHMIAFSWCCFPRDQVIACLTALAEKMEAES